MKKNAITIRRADHPQNKLTLKSQAIHICWLLLVIINVVKSQITENTGKNIRLENEIFFKMINVTYSRKSLTKTTSLA